LRLRGVRQAYDAGDVAADEFLGYGVAESGAKGVPDVFDGSLGEVLITTSAACAATLLISKTGSVLALSAALAYPPEPVEPGPDVMDLEAIQPLAA
jgi:hypothetical protein